MNSALDSLLDLLEKIKEVEFEGEGVVKLDVPDCTQRDVDAFRAGLANLAEIRPPMDYSVYFDEVKAQPMYKPGNPALALLQVAKTHKLDLESFKKAFKAAN